MLAPLMLAELSGRRALVTGASGGLGPVIARALHGRGAYVVLSGRRADALEALREDLGERVEVEVADLADRSEVERMAGLSRNVDVLVANAALPASGLLEDFTAEQIDRALDVNLRAPIQMARVAAPEMVARGAGALVFVSSMSGKVSSAGQSLYSGTKFGLRGFAFALHEELRGTGVAVSTIFPGFVRGAGMFADTGLDAPRGTGTSSPEQVAEAVLRGIETGRAEIDVAPLNVRLGVRAGMAAPLVAAAVSRRLGAADVAAEIAARQREKR